MKNVKANIGKYKVTIVDEVAVITLHNVTFKIDLKFLNDVVSKKWHRHLVTHKATGTSKTYIANSSASEGTKLLHRFIMELQGVDLSDRGKVIDHKDGDGTNCLSSNLRLVPRSTNAANRVTKTRNNSGLHNITKTGNRYYVSIMRDGNLAYIPGGFKSPSEAVEARDALGVALFGESWARKDNLNCTVQVDLEVAKAQEFQPEVK